MDIGNKLRTSRLQAKLTQEEVAERIGVSRQTVSNWENNRSYPDIMSVIRLSDLYAVSLDELLKEDKAMMRFLEESTNSVKSRERFSKILLVLAYLFIWAVAIATFWIGGRGDAMGYSLVVLYLVLPVTTFVISVLIGKDPGWANYKWLMMLFFGVMYMLARFSTFQLANTITFGKTNLPALTTMLPGMLCCAAGLLAGTMLSMIRSKKKSPER